jgi:hypothetical protein
MGNMRDSIEFVQWIKKKIIQTLDELGLLKKPYKFGYIDSAYDSGKPKILFDGETEVSTKTFPYLSSYIPVAGDRVILLREAQSYIVLGKIIN